MPTNYHTFVVLDIFIGAATNKDTVALLRKNFSTSQDMSEYINLYRDDGVPMSCHMTLNCDTVNHTGKVDAKPSTSTFTKRTGMITIISACHYGNLLLLGDKSIRGYTNTMRDKVRSKSLSIAFAQ